MSKSRCGSRSILLITTSSQVRNISGYLSGLSSPSVTEETITRASSPTRNSAGQTRLPTFSITSRSMSAERQRGQRGADHVRVEVALAAEAGVGVELGHRHVQAREPVGVVGCPARRPRARRPARRRGRAARARAGSSCRRPGALMRFTTRDAVAIEVVAVRARDRVVGVQRVLDDPDLHAVHAASSTSIDSTSSSSPDDHLARPAADAAEQRVLRIPLAGALSAPQQRGHQHLLQPRALADRVARHQVEVERERVRHHLAQVPDPHRHERHAAPGGVLDGGVDDRAGDRELVHQLW